MTNKSNYNKLYFLHIHKTGGRYLIENVIRPIKNTLHQKGISHIIEPHSHSGWHSEIDDKTYVITSLRDPAEQCISFYAHKIALNPLGELKDKYDKEKLTKKDFFEWLYNEDLYPNLQTKSFLYDEFFLKRNHPKNKSNVKLTFDENLFSLRKNQVNLFLNMNNINGRSLEIQKKIFLDLGINANLWRTKERAIPLNKESKILYNMFTEEEKEIIRKYNIEDYNFYKNTEFF